MAGDVSIGQQAASGGREDAEGAYLGVARSFSGKRWLARPGDDRVALALSQQLSLPEIVGRVLAGRGVQVDEAPAFLAPSLRESMPDPSTLRDVDRAAERIAAAIMAGETIAVFGDYDVDGATSSALLKRFIRAAGGRVRVYIPDRITEGYGPNAAALLRLRDEGASVVITVDCGTTAHEPLAEAAAAGLDLVVVDHHAAEPQLPKAYAIINPNRLDESNDLGHLAAVGVTFLLTVAVNRTLREAGWYQQQGVPAPDLLGLLDLVALGTVCDVVPLRGLNRVFVAQGLKIMARGQNTGLAALAEVAGVDERLSAYHLGFVLGPRVNAGGRVGEANLGARLLSDDDPAAAREIARHLDVLNQERRDLEAAILEQAIAQVEEQHAADGESRGLILAAGEGWHPGVIGIVASRLKDLYDRPTLVIAIDEEGIGKGSGRSVRGVDFGAAVIAARQSGLLINGGGHAMAAGLTVAADAIAELRSFLAERFARAMADSGYTATMELDGILQPGGATSELCAMLESIGPFGVGNAEPRFALTGVRIGKADVVGESHLRMFVQGADGRRLKAIAFRAMDGELGPALLAAGQQPIHLAGKLRLDNWAGRGAVQLIVEDAAPA